VSHFNASFDGIGEMLRSQMIGDALFAKGEAVRTVAEATAPFDEHEATHFRDSFHTEGPRVPEGRDRMAVTVVNDDTAAVQIELGTSKTPAHRTLTKALDAVGSE
jgi:hypothetical protein